MDKIDSFSGEYRFLSNFYMAQVEYQGITYCCSENAFQAAKTLNNTVREQFANMDPSKAKREGRRIKLRQDWESVKDIVMYEITKAKFTQNKDLKEKLLATGDAKLIEGNTWGDDYWGVCNPEKGQNKLGRILMCVRGELRSEGSS